MYATSETTFSLNRIGMLGGYRIDQIFGADVLRGQAHRHQNQKRTPR